ncbi:MAG: TerD family protein [Oscillospiraceae bacterium]
MEIQRGFRNKLENYVDINSAIEVQMSITGNSVYDYCCFGVDCDNKLSDDRYMIFYNQTASPANEITYTGNNNSAVFRIKLSELPSKINKLVFTASIDGIGKMSEISSHKLYIKQNGSSLVELNLSGSDFKNEKAIITIEIYKKDVWRFAAIASGFDGGLRELLKAYGGEEITPDVQQTPKIQESKTYIPPHVPVPEPVKHTKIELRKGQKVNLQKTGKNLGEILINLNWSQPKRSFFSFGSDAIDLDLGCLYELKDGTKGCVQALGNSFGRLDAPPFIALDGDDRTGAVASGENLRINGNNISKIKKVLVYTFIYEGAANWKEADGIVTVKCPGSPEIIVKMDEYVTDRTMCAIAMLENLNDETFSVEKLIRFFSGHSEMDRHFHWNMKWVRGRK